MPPSRSAELLSQRAGPVWLPGLRVYLLGHLLIGSVYLQLGPLNLGVISIVSSAPPTTTTPAITSPAWNCRIGPRLPPSLGRIWVKVVVTAVLSSEVVFCVVLCAVFFWCRPRLRARLGISYWFIFLIGLYFLLQTCNEPTCFRHWHHLISLQSACYLNRLSLRIV
jgi:hypothetical protein